MRANVKHLAAMVICLTSMATAVAVPLASVDAQTLEERAALDAAAVAVDPEVLSEIQALSEDERVGRALDLLRARDEDITTLQVRLAEIPTHDERAAERADVFAQLLRDIGLRDVHQDDVGNVIGLMRGEAPDEPVVVLSGHLDTVFPGVTDLDIEREGTVLRGPGASDDAAGLAAVVHLVRALREARVPLRRDLVVVGTVGEEGEGDLHGVKALFANELSPERVHAFFTLDLGAQMQIVNEGLGSRRLQVTISGPGGHSWGDFGRPNPIHALARAVTEFLSRPLPQGKRSSFNVGLIEGGRGVNVIPESASMRIDLRSESPAILQEIEVRFRAAVDSAVAREQAWSRIDIPLTVEIVTIGDRPAGHVAADSPLVTTAVAAFASQSMGVVLGSSSTDANWPLSVGVPALALPHGCQGREAHSLNEWCDTSGRVPVLAAELLTLVATAELEGPIRPRRQPTD